MSNQLGRKYGMIAASAFLVLLLSMSAVYADSGITIARGCTYPAHVSGVINGEAYRGNIVGVTANLTSGYPLYYTAFYNFPVNTSGITFVIWHDHKIPLGQDKNHVAFSPNVSNFMPGNSSMIWLQHTIEDCLNPL